MIVYKNIHGERVSPRKWDYVLAVDTWRGFHIPFLVNGCEINKEQIDKYPATSKDCLIWGHDDQMKMIRIENIPTGCRRLIPGFA